MILWKIFHFFYLFTYLFWRCFCCRVCALARKRERQRDRKRVIIPQWGMAILQSLLLHSPLRILSTHAQAPSVSFKSLGPGREPRSTTWESSDIVIMLTAGSPVATFFSDGVIFCSLQFFVLFCFVLSLFFFIVISELQLIITHLCRVQYGFKKYVCGV